MVFQGPVSSGELEWSWTFLEIIHKVKKNKFSSQPPSTKKEAQCLENWKTEDEEVLEGVIWADLMGVDIKSETLFITNWHSPESIQTTK